MFRLLMFDKIECELCEDDAVDAIMLDAGGEEKDRVRGVALVIDWDS